MRFSTAPDFGKHLSGVLGGVRCRSRRSIAAIRLARSGLTMPPPKYPPLFINAVEFQQEVSCLRGAQVGAYFLLIIYRWRNRERTLNGHIPDDDKRLRYITKIFEQRKWRNIRKKIAPLFTITDGVWRCDWLEQSISRNGHPLGLLPRYDLCMRSKWRKIRLLILERDFYTCGYCGDVATHCDHVIPLARGGETVEDNLVAACKRCNSSKGARLVSEWRGNQ